ncbi:N-acetylmuramoyl-L-alanine amidase [Mixta hanseatica]|uniref:N-acetylmuramoyl-L-alanine amidase n=1 Tax=Mixta hanseatica TaxID=2872648 RepID=A0ABY4RAQ7_9GAMM|nr:N-acetylmuramoyl-L-alanine amidase [Mixta hanseatica]UQY45516.1 N-acetylmuramoyl-L-alanine amidase [Mixta hanseatica]
MRVAVGLSLLLLWLLAGCTSGLEQRQGYSVDSRVAAQGARPRVKTVVIHYTAEDFSTSLATLTDKEVSVHYLIPTQPPQHRDTPLIWQLVPEQELAWHAGISYWRGATRLNDTSIGIELVNPGYRRTAQGRQFYPFSPAQMAALLPLLRDLINRYHIPPQNIVGHSDIAPQRKQDPGPLFPWAQLATHGIGAWPDALRVETLLQGRDRFQPVAQEALLTLLARYGYEVSAATTPEQQRRVIAAFQMHFRPVDYRGSADAETLAIAQALVEKYGR